MGADDGGEVVGPQQELLPRSDDLQGGLRVSGLDGLSKVLRVQGALQTKVCLIRLRALVFSSTDASGWH